MALSKKVPGKVFRRAHSGSYRLVKEEAKGFFEFSVKQCEAVKELFEQLAKAKCEQIAFESFLTRLLPDPAKPTTAKPGSSVLKAWESRCESLRTARSQVLSVHREGIPNRNIPRAGGDWWGAMNSITAWVDHMQDTDSDRYAHILMGSGDRLKSAALKRMEAEVLRRE